MNNTYGENRGMKVLKPKMPKKLHDKWGTLATEK